MAAGPTPSSFHLLPLDRGMAERLTTAPSWQGVDWIEHDNPRELSDALDAGGVVHHRAVIAAPTSTELDAGWIRSLHGRGLRLRILAVTPAPEPELERELCAAGISRFDHPPLDGLEPTTAFSDADYLRRMFPTELMGRCLDRYRLELPSRREAVMGAVGYVAARLDELGHPLDVVRSVVPLVLDEALCNAMDHGNRWDPRLSTHLELRILPAGFELRIRDEGPGFARENVASPLEESRRSRGGGRGLFLMEQLMDEVRYEDAGRTIVLLRGSREPTDAPAKAGI